MRRVFLATCVLAAVCFFPARSMSAQLICPGDCQGNECHNNGFDPCNQGCIPVIIQGHVTCQPRPCICPGGITARPWDDYSEPMAIPTKQEAEDPKPGA